MKTDIELNVSDAVLEQTLDLLEELIDTKINAQTDSRYYDDIHGIRKRFADVFLGRNKTDED